MKTPNEFQSAYRLKPNHVTIYFFVIFISYQLTVDDYVVIVYFRYCESYFFWMHTPLIQ